MAATASISNIYQFKISLKGSKPRIWRRIQVPGEYSFFDLHVAIQDAMGWQDYHLHQFELTYPKIGKKVLIGIPDEDDFDDTIHEKVAEIAQYFLFPKANYEYDFGNSWEHEVILEKILPAIEGMQYPQCIKGKMACPPEDCGGVYEYKELLEILANPQHKDYAERVKWYGGNFNPAKFDPKLVKFRNPEEC